METLSGLVDGIATGLGNGWIAVAGRHHDGVQTWELHRSEGLRLRVNYTNEYLRDRVRIHAVFPQDRFNLPAGMERLHIAAAVRRGADAIAADIERKLLPTYLAARERLRGLHQEMEAEYQVCQELRAKIRALLPAQRQEPEVTPRYRALHVSWSSRSSDMSVYISKLRAPDVLDISLRYIPPDLVLQICQLIADRESAQINGATSEANGDTAVEARAA